MEDDECMGNNNDSVVAQKVSEETQQTKTEKEENRDDDDDNNCELFPFKQAWQRNVERERDKLLGFFMMDNKPISRDIFHLIMSFVPAFPYYFVLRSVCSQWLYEFQEQVYDNVTFLNLVDDGRPKYYMRDDNQIVQYKPIGGTGKRQRMTDESFFGYFCRDPIFDFLGHVFSNVKHLKLGFGSFLSKGDFLSCVKCLLPKLTQLETLDILGTKQVYRNSRWKSWDVFEDFHIIALSLPSSTKNLNIIGMPLSSPASKHLSVFSRKGRENLTVPYAWFPIQIDSIKVDIQSLNLSHLFFTHGPSKAYWQELKESFSHFEVSIVGDARHTSLESFPQVVSYGDYVKFMSTKEGIVLSHMDKQARVVTESAVEEEIDAIVREYSSFHHLLGLPQSNHIYQLSAYVKPASKFVLENVNVVTHVLKLLTNPGRMKYPELVLDIDNTFDYPGYHGSCTLLSLLISKCTTNTSFSALKSIIEEHSPELAVNGVRNYLVEALTTKKSLFFQRLELIKYLLSLKPELISLGDSEGVIRDNQRDLPIIQLILSQDQGDNNCDDVKHLVEEGASLTHLDKCGNNVIHAACLATQFRTLEYLLAKCSEDFLFARNNNDQTPLELIFLSKGVRSSFSSRNAIVDFLKTARGAYFNQKRSLPSYQTSKGNLLHASMATLSIETIRWLLDNDFDANSVNEKGENALFYIQQNPSLLQKLARDCDSQPQFVELIGMMLINSGARVDIQNNEGYSVVTAALCNYNYPLINFIMLKPSCSSKPLSELLSPRMKHGFNALHILFRDLIELTNEMDLIANTNMRKLGAFPVARHCALQCLENHPEMLHEKSEELTEGDLKDISGLSPLQILLKATKGLQILNDLSIKLTAIANKPVYTSKHPTEFVPLPILYVVTHVAVNSPIFEPLMFYTHNLLLRDESQDTKPNLLHIAAKRSGNQCRCIINQWKKTYKKKAELSKIISQPLENDVVEGRKPRNAAILACEANLLEVFSVLWPYTSPFAEQFDSPVEIALANDNYHFASVAVLRHKIIPSKDQLHRIIRFCLSKHRMNAEDERKFVNLMIEAEKRQTKPSWLELMAQTPSEMKGEINAYSFLSTLQLLVCEAASIMFNWLVRHYERDPLLESEVKAVDPKTGNTLLHLLTKNLRRVESSELPSIMFSISQLFMIDSSSVEPRRATTIKAKRPSIDTLKVKEFANFINTQNEVGRTCLHHVAENSLQAILPDLLEFGASTELTDLYGRTPLDLMTGELLEMTNKFLDKREGKKSTKRKRENDAQEQIEQPSVVRPRRRRKNTKE